MIAQSLFYWFSSLSSRIKSCDVHFQAPNYQYPVGVFYGNAFIFVEQGPGAGELQTKSICRHSEILPVHPGGHPYSKPMLRPFPYPSS
ncbi:MAG: hypothetical protein CMF59_15545 [Leptospiraceae bacterium]|nr:hypothetical protein [Leptospiraceae bacterium]